MIFYTHMHMRVHVRVRSDFLSNTLTHVHMRVRLRSDFFTHNRTHHICACIKARAQLLIDIIKLRPTARAHTCLHPRARAHSCICSQAPHHTRDEN